MGLNRQLRRALAALGIAALLSAQLALAAYACEGVGTAAPAAADAIPCHPPATAPSLLCKQHCLDQQAPSDATHPPLLAASGPPAPPAATRESGRGLRPDLRRPRRDSGPPLAIRLCCLRN